MLPNTASTRALQLPRPYPMAWRRASTSSTTAANRQPPSNADKTSLLRGTMVAAGSFALLSPAAGVVS